eukprot:g8634.t1
MPLQMPFQTRCLLIPAPSLGCPEDDNNHLVHNFIYFHNYNLDDADVFKTRAASSCAQHADRAAAHTDRAAAHTDRAAAHTDRAAAHTDRAAAHTDWRAACHADEHDKQSGCWKAHHWAILGAAIGGVVFCFILGFLVFTHIDERDSSNLSEGEIEERLDRGMPLPVQYLDMRARVSEDTAALKPAMSFKSDAEYFHSKEEQQRRSFKSGATAAGLTRVTPAGTTSAKGKKAELGARGPNVRQR